MMSTAEDAEMIMEVHKQCEQIEGHLCALQHEEEGDGKNNNEEETLVAKTIPIEEVRKELPKWKDAMVSEYDSLIQHGAIEPIDERQYEELKRDKGVDIHYPRHDGFRVETPTASKGAICGLWQLHGWST